VFVRAQDTGRRAADRGTPTRMRGGYGAANNFPKVANSMGEWLEAIQLAQYKPAMQGLDTEQLRQMSTTQLKELVPIEGHRRRLVLALGELEQAPSSPSIPKQPSMKYNSTSSLYIDSTIVKPDSDEIIFCVSIVLHDRIEEGEAEPVEDNTEPSTFIDKPLFPQMEGEPGEMTSEDKIFQTIKSIYSIAEFSAECLVISLLYIERIRSLTGLQLRLRNWQPLLLAAMIVAQKVWDDKSLLNVDFSTICPSYSVKDINNLEKQFLELIQYNVYISSSLYASYYFELRTLCEKAERNFTLKPLSDEQRINLENRSEAKTEDMKKSRKCQSAGAGGPAVGEGGWN